MGFIFIICPYLSASPSISILIPIEKEYEDLYERLITLSEHKKFEEWEILLLNATASELNKQIVSVFVNEHANARHINIGYSIGSANLLNLGIGFTHADYVTVIYPENITHNIPLDEYKTILDHDQALDGVVDQISLWRKSMHCQYGYFRPDISDFLLEFCNRAIARGAVVRNRNAISKSVQKNILQKPFVIVVPSYNNANCYKQNLDSIFNQNYENYRIIYIDDASTDDTGSLVSQYVKLKKQDHRVTIIHNKQRLGAGANKFKAAQLCKDEEIYVDLDGDDWFAHNNVLSHLNSIYQDPNVWVTYGQFMYFPIGYPGWAAQLPESVIKNNSVRQTDWMTTALRTFYAGLFKKINEDDMMLNGKHLVMSSDLAFMFCIMEMAGSHSIFIPEVLYIYNVSTSQNDGTLNKQLQHQLGLALRRKKPYQPIASYLDSAPTIYVTPGLTMELFAINSPVYNRDDCLQFTYQLREKMRQLGYEVKQTNSFDRLENVHAIVCFDVPTPEQIQQLQQYPIEKRFLFLWEPPTVVPHNYDRNLHQYFSKIFTWADDLVDNKRYFKLYCPIWRPMIDDIGDFDAKEFCTMITCHKYSHHPQQLYSEREKAVQFFDKYHPDEFDLYGKGWDPTVYNTYKGSVEKKVDYLKHYKFCICYENAQGIRGYVTEKIFDAMRAGCVPIYWGAPNITDYVPKNCFIDRRDFDSNESLYAFLKNMNKETYNEYIKNIREFLSSEKAKLFSVDYFVNLVTNNVITPCTRNKNHDFYFITASNDSYYPALINLIGSIHKTNFDHLGQIAVFDLGLTQEQKTELEKIEKVQVYQVELTHPDLLKPFNTRSWGKPVPGWYAWKPVIIKQALDMFDEILYVDAGTTIYQSLDDLFDHIRANGYFLHNGSPWPLVNETTQTVISRFNLNSSEKKWLLNSNTFGLEAGFMGLSRKVYQSFVSPMYELTKDLSLFADDGTCPNGFGNSRHDLTLFSIHALLNSMKIYHHFQFPQEDIMLETSRGQIPFHIACNSGDRKETTQVYASRTDIDLNYFMQFIRFKNQDEKEVGEVAYA